MAIRRRNVRTPPVRERRMYLRGDIGSAIAGSTAHNALDAANTSSSQHLGFNTAGILALASLPVQPLARGDATGGYRGNSIHGSSRHLPRWLGAHSYHAKLGCWPSRRYVDLAPGGA